MPENTNGIFHKESFPLAPAIDPATKTLSIAASPGLTLRVGPSIAKAACKGSTSHKKLHVRRSFVRVCARAAGSDSDQVAIHKHVAGTLMFKLPECDE